MLNNYIKIAWRNLIKYKNYSFVNILGLAIGLAACMLIFLFIHNELGYDSYHKNADYIYRVERYGVFNGKKYHYPNISAKMAPTIAEGFPEILQYVRFRPYQLHVLDKRLTYKEERLIATDSNVFEVFSFELKRGNPNKALKDPYSVVITEEMAERYVSPGDPIGQTLTVISGNQKYNFHVTGIIEKFPRRSHFHTQFLFSFSTLKTFSPDEYNNWISMTSYTYLLLDKDSDSNLLENKFANYMKKYFAPISKKMFGSDYVDEDNELMKLSLRPLKNIYLHSDLDQEIEATGDINLIYILLAIAVLILIIACINFINLSIARSLNRTKEICLRKSMGASQSSIIIQLIGETIGVVIIAFILALFIAKLSLPLFNIIIQKELVLFHGNYLFLVIFFIFTILIGGTAGTFPAIYMSSFQPATMLKKVGRTGTGSFAIVMRKGLVILQFTISIFLLISTLFISSQLDFILNRDPGFDQTNVIDVNINDRRIKKHIKAIRTALLQDPNILQVSTTSDYLGQVNYSDPGMMIESGTGDDVTPVNQIYIDEYFIPAMKMKIIAGRNFSTKFGEDSNNNTCIINKTAAKRFGWNSPEDALGHYLVELNINAQDRKKSKIIGVVDDFNFTSSRKKIEPLAFLNDSKRAKYLYVRLSGNNISGSLDKIEETLKQFAPDHIFTSFFQDLHFVQLHKNERNIERIFMYCAGLAIFIACMGLFALAAYLINLRTKEVGIRKILGASSIKIWNILSIDFIKLVLIANFIAWPLAFYFIYHWLQNFAYRITITIWPFLLAGLMALTISVLTVSWQALKAARTNPIESLRYE